MKIIVGTKNQKKVRAVHAVFEEVLNFTDIEVQGYDADSNVPEAPIGEETYKGALNRALACSEVDVADYYVGLESGLVERYGNYFEEAWAVVISADGSNQLGYSSGLMLPPVVANRMRSGEKHNDIMAYYDTKLGSPEDSRDTWSRYTGGAISRQISLEEALRNALIQLTGTDKNLYR